MHVALRHCVQQPRMHMVLEPFAESGCLLSLRNVSITSVGAERWEYISGLLEKNRMRNQNELPAVRMEPEDWKHQLMWAVKIRDTDRHRKQCLYSTVFSTL